MKLSRLAVAAIAACLLGVTACSDNEASSGPAPDGKLEKTELKVGVLPLADYAAIYWADQKGLFSKAGLSVKLEPIQGGPIGIQKVAAGELDYAISNTVSSSISQAQRAPVRNVAFTAALGTGSGIVFVKPDSPIRTIDDLNGKSLGTNTTRNIGDVTFANLVRSEGKDIKPNWVEVPFAEMVSGVAAGSIDAGYAPEPFSSAAKQAGMREVADVTNGPNEHLAASVIVSGDRFVNQNPDTTAAFVRAVYEAGEQMRGQEQQVRAWLPSVAKVSEQVAQSMVLPVYSSQMDLPALEKVADMLKAQKLIPEDFDIASHTYELPRG